MANLQRIKEICQVSYQAITDIIVNPNQLRDLQLSSTVKDSPNTSSSVSFADFLASYTNEEPAKPETTASEAPKAVSEADVSDKTDKIEDNSSEKSVEKAAESESDESVEKTEAKDSDKKVDDKNQIKEKTSENKEFAQKSAATPKSEAASSTEKNELKTKDNGKQKKLSEKDFSRLEEIAERAENLNDSAKSAAAVQNVAKTSDKLELKDDSDSDSDSDSVPEITVSTDASSEIVLNQTADNKSETSDFDFSGSKGENKKQFALDKDGKITVEDQRTKLESETEPAESKKSALKTSEIRLTNDSTAVMSVELNPNAEADVLSLNTQTAASNGSNFQAMLSNQLSNVAPEFVKAGNLVLKDNNQGTINLVLHPDDLGNVKIHLSLDGKTLSGHITVATKEALQVFKDNAETLREAFIKSGFDAANFDVAMNNGGSFNQNMGFEGQNDGSNLFARRAYGNSAGGLSAELDSILENAEDISNYSVNIVA
jgi:flagellar hook-length control protein FliK